MYLIDTRKYDDSFLLAKILEKVDITNEEKKKLFKHFEKPGVVDVVEVVRCKDCIHNQLPPTRGNAECELWYGMTDLYGYCHYGERRKDAKIS